MSCKTNFEQFPVSPISVVVECSEILALVIPTTSYRNRFHRENRAVETLEAEVAAKTLKWKSSANGATGSSGAQAPDPPTAKELGEARFALIREAQRVAGLRKMNVAEVVNKAAKGFTYEKVKQLTVDHIPAMKAATDVLRKVAS